MFDEFDSNALGITLVMSVLFAIFFFRDPFGVGMSDLNLASRIIGWLIGTVLGYFIAAKMLDN